MRKSLILALMGFTMVTGVFGISVTTAVNPGGFVNLIAGFNNSVQVSQVAVSANTTNASALLIDAPTNSLTYVLAAYTNTTSYVTNYVTTWTNYYGVVNSTTNIALIDNVTQVVAQSTNANPIRLSVATAASTSTTYGGVNYYFNRGMWATNNSSGIATITVTFR